MPLVSDQSPRPATEYDRLDNDVRIACEHLMRVGLERDQATGMAWMLRNAGAISAESFVLDLYATYRSTALEAEKASLGRPPHPTTLIAMLTDPFVRGGTADLSALGVTLANRLGERFGYEFDARGDLMAHVVAFNPTFHVSERAVALRRFLTRVSEGWETYGVTIGVNASGTSIASSSQTEAARRPPA